MLYNTLSPLYMHIQLYIYMTHTRWRVLMHCVGPRFLSRLCRVSSPGTFSTSRARRCSWRFGPASASSAPTRLEAGNVNQAAHPLQPLPEESTRNLQKYWPPPFARIVGGVPNTTLLRVMWTLLPFSSYRNAESGHRHLWATTQ